MAALFKQHGEAVYGYCARVMRDPVIAEDLMQQVFFEAFRDFDRFRGQATRRAWLFGIAANRCVDALRRRKRESARAGPELTEETTTEAQPAAGAPDLGAFAHLTNARLLVALEACLGVLSPEVRATVALRFHTDLTYEQMAEYLDARPDALQMRISRAMPVLRRCLESTGWDR